MKKQSPTSGVFPNLFKLLEQHPRAFRQERSDWRGVGLVMGALFNFGRRTVTHGLMALGLTDEDWRGWYRLFSRGRYAEARVARIFFRETAAHVAGRAICRGLGWGANSAQQFEAGGDELAESPTHTRLQSGHPSRATLRAWGLADPAGGGL